MMGLCQSPFAENQDLECHWTPLCPAVSFAAVAARVGRDVEVAR